MAEQVTWDRGTKIAAIALAINVIVMVGAYFTFKATTEVKLDQVIQNQAEFKQDADKRDEKLDGLQGNHFDTKARVGVLETIAKSTAEAIGEIKKSADKTYDKVDRLEDLVRDSLIQKKAAADPWGITGPPSPASLDTRR